MASHYIMLDDVDLSKPEANHLDWLFWLKGKYPNFEVNLFCIPQRCTEEWLHNLRDIDWVNICMHGWNHDETEEITFEMIDDWNFRTIYKGPNWKLPGRTEPNLLNRGWKVIKKPLPDNYFQGHIWSITDLQRLEEVLKTGVYCKKITEE